MGGSIFFSVVLSWGVLSLLVGIVGVIIFHLYTPIHMINHRMKAKMNQKGNVYRPSTFGTPRLYQRNTPVFVGKKEAKILRGWLVTDTEVYDYSRGDLK